MAKNRSASSTSDCRRHWQAVYVAREAGKLSWHHKRPQLSLRLIRNAGIGFDEPIIDVGGGASTLVDALLDKGYENLTVLDISAAALGRSRERLGNDSKRVQWLVADVLAFQPKREYALWHDRALFHFLTRRAQQRAYIETLSRTLRHGGQAIIASFGIEGPRKCSGLNVVRYDTPRLQKVLGSHFEILQTVDETHLTPAGATQAFAYFRLRMR